MPEKKVHPYAYYPGCSLEATSKQYDISLRAVAPILGLELKEIEDWNCCGASAYFSSDQIMGFALAARNLVLAEKMGLDILAPCAACYAVLKKANNYFKDDPKVEKEVNDALASAGLKYTGGAKVKHLLEVLVNDFERKEITDKIVNKLGGMKLAPYYGCMVVRPTPSFDDPWQPTTMDTLLTDLGATVVDYPLKTKCCGGTFISTHEEIALRLVHNLLRNAVDNGADAIVTICPLCQFNLDNYQDKINKMFDDNIKIPIVYLSQIMGVAFGLKPEELGLDKHAVRFEPALAASSKMEAGNA
jgi:heterodisulfide reductase subunit B2